MPLGEHQSTLYISLISGDLGLRSHLPRQSRTPIFVSLAVWGCWKLWWILCLLVSTFCPILSFSFYDPNWQIPWMWPENIVHVSRSVVPDSATPWRVAYQAPPPMGLSRQEYWSGLPFPSPGDLPDPVIKSRSPALQVDSLPAELPGKLRKYWIYLIISPSGILTPQVLDIFIAFDVL